jgi:tripartite-type tricarboxylate transporter receptor subunit TctC
MHFLKAAMTALVVMTMAGAASAQSWPNRTVRVVVP